MLEDAYRTLGLSPDTTIKEIREAYHNLVRLYHPDSNVGDEAAGHKFTEVADAYNLISDAIREHCRRLDVSINDDITEITRVYIILCEQYDIKRRNGEKNIDDEYALMKESYTFLTQKLLQPSDNQEGW